MNIKRKIILVIGGSYFIGRSFVEFRYTELLEGMQHTFEWYRSSQRLQTIGESLNE